MFAIAGTRFECPFLTYDAYRMLVSLEGTFRMLTVPAEAVSNTIITCSFTLRGKVE